MPVVRYAALAALVFWLGGTTHALAGDLSRQMTFVALGSGAVMLVALFVMKFVGPPPHGFVLRVGLVAAMMAIGLVQAIWGPSMPMQAGTLALGLVLLGWYARE
jgi:hypothetical protein